MKLIDSRPDPLRGTLDVATGTRYLPYYDANGNVHALVNRADGAITAAYEYSAFGETVRATGRGPRGSGCYFLIFILPDG